MPRYYFHLNDGDDSRDLEGTDLADDASARAEAIVTAGAVLKDLGGAFWQGEDWSMLVENEAGATFCELRISGKGGP